MRPVRFTDAARAELIDAQDWYEAEAPGLGRRFRAEIDSVVRRMADNPRQFPTVFRDEAMPRDEVFISYSHGDKEWLELIGRRAR